MSAGTDHVMPARDAGSSPRPAKVRELLAHDGGSALARYRRLTYPDVSASRFWLFELATMLLLPMPGGLGMLLRRKLLRPFLGALGRDVIIGRNCVLRNPQRIFIGDGVIIDDNCVLDARGTDAAGLRLADGALVSRNVQIKSKGGPIDIGRDVTIGDGTQIVSQTGVHIGDTAAIAAACQIFGGTFALSEFNKPAAERRTVSAGPIAIGAGSWLATGVIVLDGARIGADCIVSAGSVVTRSIPDRCVAQGNPAKKVFDIR
jgi:acetyltransferase-like isoleucine patch superfamily enzyme